MIFTKRMACIGIKNWINAGGFFK
ncbi:MAG: hypothetical protein RL748_1378, partial [Pseudomonadota bacterium]